MPNPYFNQDPFAGGVMDAPDATVRLAMLKLANPNAMPPMSQEEANRLSNRMYLEQQSHNLAMKQGQMDVARGFNTPNAQTYLANTQQPSTPRQQIIAQLMQQPQATQPAPFSPRNLPGMGEMVEMNGVPIYGGGMSASTPRPEAGYGYAGGINPYTGEASYVNIVPGGTYRSSTPGMGAQDYQNYLQSKGMIPQELSSHQEIPQPLAPAAMSTFEQLLRGPTKTPLSTILSQKQRPPSIIDVTGEGQSAVPIIDVTGPGQTVPPIIDVTGQGQPAVPIINVFDKTEEELRKTGKISKRGTATAAHQAPPVPILNLADMTERQLRKTGTIAKRGTAAAYAASPAPIIDVTGPGQPIVPIIDVTGPGMPSAPTIDVTGEGMPSPDYVSPLYSPYSALFNKQGQFDVVNKTGNYQSPFYSPYSNLMGEAQSQLGNYVAPTASPMGSFTPKRPTLTPEEVARSLLGPSIIAKIPRGIGATAQLSDREMAEGNPYANMGAMQESLPVAAQQIPQSAPAVAQQTQQPADQSFAQPAMPTMQAPQAYTPGQLNLPAYNPPGIAGSATRALQAQQYDKMYQAQTQAAVNQYKAIEGARQQAVKLQSQQVKDAVSTALNTARIGETQAKAEAARIANEFAKKGGQIGVQTIKDSSGKEHQYVLAQNSVGRFTMTKLDEARTAEQKNIEDKARRTSEVIGLIKSGNEYAAMAQFFAMHPTNQLTGAPTSREDYENWAGGFRQNTGVPTAPAAPTAQKKQPAAAQPSTAKPVPTARNAQGQVMEYRNGKWSLVK